MAMSEALVRQVLSMGIDPSRVKMAIKKQLESYGYGFNNPEHLINAAFSVQRQQERRVTREHQNPSGAMLSGGGFGGSGSSVGQRRSFDEVRQSWIFLCFQYIDTQPLILRFYFI